MKMDNMTDKVQRKDGISAGVIFHLAGELRKSGGFGGLLVFWLGGWVFFCLF